MLSHAAFSLARQFSAFHEVDSRAAKSTLATRPTESAPQGGRCVSAKRVPAKGTRQPWAGPPPRAGHLRGREAPETRPLGASVQDGGEPRRCLSWAEPASPRRCCLALPPALGREGRRARVGALCRGPLASALFRRAAMRRPGPQTAALPGRAAELRWQCPGGACPSHPHGAGGTASHSSALTWGPLCTCQRGCPWGLGTASTWVSFVVLLIFRAT